MHTSNLPICVPRSLRRSGVLRAVGLAAVLSGAIGLMTVAAWTQAAEQRSTAGGVTGFFRGLFSRGDQVSRLIAPQREAVREAEKRVATAEKECKAAMDDKKSADAAKKKMEGRIAVLNKELGEAKNEKERARAVGKLSKTEKTAASMAAESLTAQRRLVNAQQKVHAAEKALEEANKALTAAKTTAEKQVADAKAAAEKARSEAQKKKAAARAEVEKQRKLAREAAARKEAEARIVKQQREQVAAKQAELDRAAAAKKKADAKAAALKKKLAAEKLEKEVAAREKAEAKRLAEQAEAAKLKKELEAEKQAELARTARAEQRRIAKAKEDKARADAAARKAAEKKIFKDEKHAKAGLEDARDDLDDAKKNMTRATQRRDTALERYQKATGVVTARASDVEHAKTPKAKKQAMRALTKAQDYAAEAENSWKKADKAYQGARDKIDLAKRAQAKAEQSALAAKLAADDLRKRKAALAAVAPPKPGFLAGLFGSKPAQPKPAVKKPAIKKPAAKRPAAPKVTKPPVVKPPIKPAAPTAVAKKPASAKGGFWSGLFGSKPTQPKPAVKKPAAKKPAAPKSTKPPVVKPPAKPAAPKAVAKKPASGKGGFWSGLFASKPAKPKPAVKKPVVKKPAIKKPAAKKPAAPKSTKPPVVKPPVKPAAPTAVAKKPASGKGGFWSGLLPSKSEKPKAPATKPAKKKAPAKTQRKPKPAPMPKPVLIPVKRVHETAVSDVTPWTVPTPQVTPQLAGEQKLTTPPAKPGNVAKGEKTIQFDVAMTSGDKDIVEKLKVWKDWADYVPFNPVTIREVNEFHGKLTKALQEEGYVFAKVTFPTRIWAMGIFLAKVDCGPLGTIIVRGNRHYSAKQIIRSLQRQEGDRFNYARIHGDLFDLNTKPDITVNTKLKPVMQDGRRVINAEIDVKDDLPIHGAFEASNTGTQQTNDWRFRTTVQHLNLTKHDDVLSLDWLTSPDWHDVNAYSGSYFLPLSDQYSLNVYGGYSKSNINDVMPQLDVRGKGHFFGGQITRTFWDTPQARWQASAGWMFQHTETHHDVPGLTLSQRRLDLSMPSITIGYASRTFDRLGGRNFLSNSIMGNFAGSYGSSQNSDFNAQGAGNASGDFMIDRFQIARLQHFFRGEEAPGKWSLFMKFEGQLTSDTLIPEMRKSVGGMNSVRGYEEDNMSGDQAFVGTLELRTPLFHNFIPGLKKSDEFLAANPDAWQRHRLQFLLFTDFGYVEMKNPLPGEQDSDTLLGVGAGLRLGLTKYSQMSLDFGYPLEKTQESDNPRAHLSLQLQF